MATGNPSLLTLNMAGLDRTSVAVLALTWGAELAVDMRPKATDASVEYVRRALQWAGRIPQHRHLPDLHGWQDDPQMPRRLAASIRKFGRVLLVCCCAEDCTMPDLAKRMQIAVPGIAVGSLNDALVAPPSYDLPSAGMAPDAVKAHLDMVAHIDRLRTDPAVAAAKADAIAQMTKAERYRVTTVNENYRKRSVVGYFSGLTGNTLFIEDANGRMNRLPVDRITYIARNIETEAEQERAA